MELRCEECNDWFYYNDTFEPPEVSLCEDCKDSIRD